MLSLARKSVSMSVNGFMENKAKNLKCVTEYENAIDDLQTEITKYLVKLSQKSLTKEETEELPVLIHSVNDIERIGDHSENILELAERKIDKKIKFSPEGDKAAMAIWKEVENMIKETEEALAKSDKELAIKALTHEETINTMWDEYKKAHINRLNKKECNFVAGVLFIDYLDNLEKIADHLTNIAQAVLSGMRWQDLKAN